MNLPRDTSPIMWTTGNTMIGKSRLMATCPGGVMHGGRGYGMVKYTHYGRRLGQTPDFGQARSIRPTNIEGTICCQNNFSSLLWPDLQVYLNIQTSQSDTLF